MHFNKIFLERIKKEFRKFSEYLFDSSKNILSNFMSFHKIPLDKVNIISEEVEVKNFNKIDYFY